MATSEKAMAATDASKPLVPFSFDRREPSDDDVLIAIKHCGVCHSDIHHGRQRLGQSVLSRWCPATRSPAWSRAVGSKNVSRLQGRRPRRRRLLRQHAAPPAPPATWTASSIMPGLVLTYSGSNSRRQRPAHLRRLFRPRASSRKAMCCRIPDNLPLDAAAPLLCAGITLYSPLRHWNAGPGKKVAILGLGGLGHMGVKLAHAMGADVTVLSQTAVEEGRRHRDRRQRLLRHQRPQDLQDACRNVRPDHLHGRRPPSTGTPISAC